MPVDVRKLIFSRHELRFAFQKFALDKHINVPDSAVESIQVIDGGRGDAMTTAMDEGLKVVLRYTTDTPGNPFRVQLDSDQILEALVNMCRGLRIPLPRRGQKFLQKHQDTIALTMAMSEEDMRAARSSSD